MAEAKLQQRLTPGLLELHDSLRDKSYFSLNRNDTLFLLNRAFGPEIEYLKSAYVPFHPGISPCTTLSPSQVLFGTKLDEVDRTLTGVLSLQWIYNKDHSTFIKHQNSAMSLTQQSFLILYDFFCRSTQNFEDYETLFILIILQITNDLGKSGDLRLAVEEQLGASRVSHNHDVIMSQALVNSSTRNLVPSFQCLRSDQQEIVEKHIRLSAHFNPGQLVQAECPPAALDILTDSQFGGPELTLKFLEYFMDLAGAKGHMNHEGAEMLIEPVLKSFWRACEITTRVAINSQHSSPRDAYNTILTDRVELLAKAGWVPAYNLNIRRSSTDYAKVRIFCMGRVVNAAKATQFNAIFDALPIATRTSLEIGLKISGKPGNDGQLGKPAVLPTYMPQMILNAAASEKSDEAIAAVLTYMSRVLILNEKDKQSLEDVNTIIVERDVRNVLEKLIKSDDFRENPSSVVNETTPLPKAEVFQIHGVYDC